MTQSTEDHSRILGEALADALDRATGASLDSLHALHTSVRGFAAQKRRQGHFLEEVLASLQLALASAEDDRSVTADGVRIPDKALARQIEAWCRRAYGED